MTFDLRENEAKEALKLVGLTTEQANLLKVMLVEYQEMKYKLIKTGKNYSITTGCDISAAQDLINHLMIETL